MLILVIEVLTVKHQGQLKVTEQIQTFQNRVIGQAVKNSKEATEYVEPEYQGKRFPVCKGKFNIKSKYHVCQLCDLLIYEI